MNRHATTAYVGGDTLTVVTLSPLSVKWYMSIICWGKCTFLRIWLCPTGDEQHPQQMSALQLMSCSYHLTHRSVSCADTNLLQSPNCRTVLPRQVVSNLKPPVTSDTAPVSTAKAVSELRCLFVGIAHRRQWFVPRIMYILFVFEKVVLRQFPCVLHFLPVYITPSLLRSHRCIS
jgi:hypothetical protein